MVLPWPDNFDQLFQKTEIEKRLAELDERAGVSGQAGLDGAPVEG